MGLITSHRDICMVRSREGGGGLEERSEEGLLDCFGASLGWMGKEVGRVNELNKREVFRMRERWLGGRKKYLSFGLVRELAAELIRLGCCEIGF